MDRIIRTGLATAFVVGSAVALAPTAAAEERVCRGSIGAVTLDDIRVPTGATCTLNGTALNGTLKVERGGTLYASRVRVNGNIQAEGHRLVRVYTSQVGGSVQLVQGGTVDVRSTAIKGDAQLFSNATGRVTYLASNRVDGNLQCKDNQPAPTGSGNIVQGTKEDQCAQL
ncbi:MAG: hypothetical protein ACRCYX_04855 [Dermatophilaceae bacterium]